MSQLSQKIKIKKPVCGAFTIQTSREGSLAAGLDMKLTVLYDSKENIRRSDRVMVVTENNEIEIPLNVYPHVGKLEFEPFINFGFVKMGNTAETIWNIVNRGETGVKLKFQPLIIEQTTILTLSQD